MECDYDMVIVGGGLAGNCLAWALRDSGLRIAIVEAASRTQLQSAPAGDRALALAAGTVKALDALALWPPIADKATAIHDIHVSDQGHFGKTRLSAAKNHVPALGYVISARDIENHVAEQVAHTATTVFAPARVVGLMAGAEAIHISLKQGQASLNLSARLLVGADGGQSSVRTLLDIPQEVTDYRQTALVTTVKAALPHRHTAYERFTAAGPLALLPMGKRHLSVVWTRNPEEAETLLTANEARFVAELQNCFGWRLGELTLAAPRRAFPLTLVRAQALVAPRAAIVGNAAHQLHPVAGQGFNLGLRDVLKLAEALTLSAQQALDPGCPQRLAAYAQARQQDHDRVIGFTDSLVKLFSNDTLLLAAGRNLGLTLLDHLPGAKNWLAKQAMGLLD